MFVEGYESGTPDERLNPKKKIWEKLQVRSSWICVCMCVCVFIFGTRSSAAVDQHTRELIRA